MRTFIAIAMFSVAAFGGVGAASAACSSGSPDAITSKPPADAAAADNQQAAADAKGISEDGQHTPMETDPNAPGVTQTEGGTTTNTEQAESEIAAASDKPANTSSTPAQPDAMATSASTEAGCTN